MVPGLSRRLKGHIHTFPCSHITDIAPLESPAVQMFLLPLGTFVSLLPGEKVSPQVTDVGLKALHRSKKMIYLPENVLSIFHCQLSILKNALALCCLCGYDNSI